MAVRVVEFTNGVYRILRIRVMGSLSSLQKSEVLKLIIYCYCWDQNEKQFFFSDYFVSDLKNVQICVIDSLKTTKTLLFSKINFTRKISNTIAQRLEGPL